jgi:hypothetical protein
MGMSQRLGGEERMIEEWFLGHLVSKPEVLERVQRR